MFLLKTALNKTSFYSWITFGTKRVSLNEIKEKVNHNPRRYKWNNVVFDGKEHSPSKNKEVCPIKIL